MSGGWFPVEGVARLAVTGADRVRYLNGQVSNDVRKLDTGRAIRACVLSAKGKLEGVIWIWNDVERLAVEVDASRLEDLQMRLEKYIVADDVELIAVPVGECIHVFGDVVEKIPAEMVARRISRLGMPGVDVEAAGCVLWLSEFGVEQASVEIVERIRIEHAVPVWGHELAEDTLPAEAGLDRTAVDFHKGCYIGQEVVSRVESVGHVNRALRVFELVDGGPPAVGAEYFSSTEDSRPAAVVTSVSFALSPAIGLCYMRRGTPEGEVLVSASAASRIRTRPCVQPS